MPKLQHIRSATPDKRPDPVLLADGQLSINTASATPGVYTKNDVGGLIKVGPTFVGSAAPNSSPSGSAGNSVGEHWMDTSVAPPVLRVWDGSSWIASQGLTGPQGEVGPQGPAGADGAAGPQGPAGVDGAAGPQGAPGNDGAAGGQGPQGEVGPQGPAGNDGAVGGQGPQGEVGPQGPAGTDGAAGGQGPQGEVGPQGAPGNDGAAGGQGPQGEVGPQGPSGPQGDSLFTLTPGDQIVPVEQIRTLQITGGSATSPAYSCIGGIGTGISFPSTTELQLNTENVARLTINSAGGWNVNGSSSEVGLVLTGNGWAAPPSWQAPKGGGVGGTLFASVAFNASNSDLPAMNPTNVVAVVNISQTGPAGARDGRFNIIFNTAASDSNYKVVASCTAEDTHVTNACIFMAWEQASYRPYTKLADNFNVYFVANDGTGRYPRECDLIVVA